MEHHKLLSQRHQMLMKQLMNEGIVRVDEASVHFGVSAITIRRDLDFLQKQGLLERIHGGALPLKNQQQELSYSRREQIQVKEKMAIGKKAAEIIQEKSIIFLSSGSTTLEVLRNLLGRNVQVLTNNVEGIHLLNQASSAPALELIIVGGQYRYQSHSLAGDLALASISDIYSSYTVLGVNGIHPTYGVTSSWYRHISLYKKMVENCKGKLIIVADSSKVDVISNFVCAKIEMVDILVTDREIKTESIEQLESIGIQVLTA